LASQNSTELMKQGQDPKAALTSLDFPSNLRSTSDGSLLGGDRTAAATFSPPMIILSSVCGTSVILLSTGKQNTLQPRAYMRRMI
jgi:hypothetical protein